ncbi:MAG: hypothetical protein ACE147_00530 [Candidatus Methylomirabilales bacterium]
MPAQRLDQATYHRRALRLLQRYRDALPGSIQRARLYALLLALDARRGVRRV